MEREREREKEREKREEEKRYKEGENPWYGVTRTLRNLSLNKIDKNKFLVESGPEAFQV